jgi:hypothetical protein
MLQGMLWYMKFEVLAECLDSASIHSSRVALLENECSPQLTLNHRDRRGRPRSMYRFREAKKLSMRDGQMTVCCSE